MSPLASPVSSTLSSLILCFFSSQEQEAAAAQNLFQNQQACEVATHNAQEQARRAHAAEQIYARALEEYRQADAAAKATAAQAAEAKAIFDRAAAAFKKAEEVCKTEVAAAEKTAAVAREAETALNQAASVEAQTASTLSQLQQHGALAPVYTQRSGYGYY